MSTENDELKDRVNAFGKGKEFSTGKHPFGFQDVSGEYPRTSYFYGPSTNEGARGIKKHELYIGGGNLDMDLGLDPIANSVYPFAQVDESRSGHVIEIDDTPGGERILIRHRTGAGVEMRPDGSVVVATKNNLVHIVYGDNKVIVEGDADLTYNGNLNIDVQGDMNVKVGGNYVLDAGNDITTTVKGNVRSVIDGNKGEKVSGNNSQTTVGTRTDTTLGSENKVVKGSLKEVIGTTYNVTTGSDFRLSSQTNAFITARVNANMAAPSISVFGDTGTIGGQNVIMYNYNMYTGHSISAGDTVSTTTVIASETMTSKEFIGSLTGNADQATQSGISGGPGGSAGTKVTGSPATVDTTATAEPNAENVSQLVQNSTVGSPIVAVDASSVLTNAIDRTVDNGNVSNRNLSPREVRSKLRDDATLQNTTFVTTQIGAGTLSPDFASSAPPSLGRIEAKAPTAVIGLRTIGQKMPGGATKKIKPKPIPRPITPNPLYNPNRYTEITSSTKLGRGITMAKFLGGRGDKVTLDHITTLSERKSLARQFYLQAEALRLVQNDKDGKFKDHRMVIIEGLYKKGPNETLTAGSFNDLATKGQVVVYELLGANGRPDHLKTFDLAVYLKDNLFYDKLTLSYDKFDPFGDFTSQIVIQMPAVTETFSCSYQMEIATLFNNKVQATKEFIEILQS